MGKRTLEIKKIPFRINILCINKIIKESMMENKRYSDSEESHV